MIASSMVDVRQRLSDPDLPVRIAGLGFRDRDAADLLDAVVTVRQRDDDLDNVERLAGRLMSRIGQFAPSEEPSVWSGIPERTTGLGVGVLPMLALLVTAPEVATFHARRGVSAEISAATLADLGQQVWVHRLTYGEFGLHTYGWLSLAWSGALYWLGRLQFNLQQEADLNGEGEWVMSTHIPRTGPLSPDQVDASLATALDFFATHFPDYPARDFCCQSWLLDPELAAALPRSNLAAFQRRWQLVGKPQPGDVDSLFFIFLRRGPVDVATLPSDTTLQRVTAEKLAAGESWSVYRGRIRP